MYTTSTFYKQWIKQYKSEEIPISEEGLDGVIRAND